MRNRFFLFLLFNIVLVSHRAWAQNIMENLRSHFNIHQPPGSLHHVSEFYGETTKFSQVMAYRQKIPLSLVHQYRGFLLKNSASALNSRSKIIGDSRTETGNEAWISHYASSMASSYDVANSITLDPQRNPIVTGFSSTMPYGADMVTTKYDTSGNQLWQSKFAIGGDAIGSSIHADTAGNVYVLGEAMDGATGPWRDILVKYDINGTQGWFIKLDGDAEFYLTAVEVSVDRVGNIYVTGDSANDFIAKEYTSQGVQQSETIYPGGMDGFTRDTEGNIYIFKNDNDGILTAKYDSLGNQEWAKRYKDPSTSDDGATGIAVDSIGNCYIVGNSYVGADNWNRLFTVKYNSMGVQQWVSTYSDTATTAFLFGGNIQLDRVGRIFFSAERDYNLKGTGIELNYSSSGALRWIRSYPDEVYAFCVDSSGDSYLTGNAGTISYDSSGNQLWKTTYVGQTITPMPAGVYLSPYGSYGVARYDPKGNWLWAQRYIGQGNSYDEPIAIAVDKTGNVFVVGESESSLNNGYDIYSTVKFDSSGNRLWAEKFSGNAFDYPSAITIDDSDNSYVTGITWNNTDNSYDWCTIKYDFAGNQRWVAQYAGPGNSDDRSSAVAVDKSGNVYVTGYSGDSSATIKYNSSGFQQWVEKFEGSGSDICIDRVGNAYVTGSNSIGGVTVKYDSNGHQLWTAQYDSVGLWYIGVDTSGNVAVSGSIGGDIWNNNYNYDYITIKYGQDGTQQWMARYNGTSNDFDQVAGMTVDNVGDVYVTGISTEGVESWQDQITTIKYSPSGEQKWIQHFAEASDDFNQAVGPRLDTLGNTYVSGTTGDQWVTIKYGKLGNQEGVERYVFSHDFNAAGFIITSNPAGIDLDAKGNVYVAGYDEEYVGNYWLWSVFTVAKYDYQTLDAIQMPSKEKPSHFSLAQNYPNPFNPSTTITYNLPINSSVTLTVYDVLGRVITTLVDGRQNAGNHSVTFDASRLASGIYFYQLRAGSFMVTKKLMVLK